MAKAKVVVSDELLVLDESDLAHVVSEKALTRLKEWQALLKESRNRDRLRRGNVLPTECTLEVSVKDLLAFDGLRSQATQGNPCVAAIPVAGLQAVDAIVTGCIVRVKSVSWDIGAKFKEPIRIGSSMRTVWLDFSAKADAKRSSASLEYTAMRRSQPDRIMGLSGVLEVGKAFQVVPPPIPQLLVLYDTMGLVTEEDALKCTATVPFKGGDRVVIPETHYLAQYIKQTTMTYFNRVCLFSCADATKGECSYLVLKKSVFEQLKADFLEKYTSVMLRTDMSSHFVYVQYKESGELYKDPHERLLLEGGTPREELEKKCTIVVEVAAEYYERAEDGHLRSARDVDGVYVAGTPLVDMTKPSLSKNGGGLEFPTVSHANLIGFYRDKTEERIQSKGGPLKELYVSILKAKVNEG